VTAPAAAVSEQAIRRTLAEYCQLLDDGRFDEWVEVFSEDVVFAVMGQVARGRAAVRALIEPAQQADARGRHLLSEPMITVDGDTARVTTDYCFVSRALTVSSAGRYHDVLRREGDRWRIAAREVVFLGDEPRGTG
jgi:3-phenylpropionate/cinnamic acid dioxygenase small subunit